MGAMYWVRLSRRLPGVVRQRELANLEALIDAEENREPARNLFILSCAIPAGIATFGGLSVFAAWVMGNKGLPLILGSAATVVLSAAAWFIFYRLYRAIPPAQRHLRDLILKFGQRYTSFGNVVSGDMCLAEPFATLLDEAAGIYLRHCSVKDSNASEPSTKAMRAIEEAMIKLMEVAVQTEHAAHNRALAWGQPMLEELRLLDQSLLEHASAVDREAFADPLANLRGARAELETGAKAAEELDQHLGVR